MNDREDLKADNPDLDAGKEAALLKAVTERAVRQAHDPGPERSRGAAHPHSIAHLATRIFGRPLLIAPEKFHIIMSVLAPRLGLMPEAVAPASPAPAYRKPYMLTPDGIAIIPISGTLVHKSHGLDALSGLQSYADLGAQIEDAATDPVVKGILLDCDSPGGELAGAFDLADMIYQARATKPIYAVADNDAFSAAYLMASCAEKVFATRTSGLGSVGVIMSHIDESAADAKEGLKYTIVTAGARKADRSPHAPLSEEARTQMQTMVDQAYGMLCETVARNRGVSAEAIKATEGGIYFGAGAIKAGLADQMGTFTDALDALRAQIANPLRAPAQAVAQPAAAAAENIVDSTSTTALMERATLAAEESHAMAVQIADLCVLANLPGETAALLKRKASIEQTREHLVKKQAEISAQSEVSSYLLPRSNRNPQGELVNPQGSELMLAAVDRLLAKGK